MDWLKLAAALEDEANEVEREARKKNSLSREDKRTLAAATVASCQTLHALKRAIRKAVAQ